jgi:hypothetical protein
MPSIEALTRTLCRFRTGTATTSRRLWRPALVLLTLPTLAAAIGVPQGLGWHEIANSRIRPLCPFPNADPGLFGVCQNVTGAWSGGAFDVQRNKLYIFGGGHADYAGNEVYVLDVNTLQLSRLNQPSSPVRDGCVDGTNAAYADGRPVARHTYSNLEFFPAGNRLLMFGGSRWKCGFFDRDTWLFDPANDSWTKQTTTVAPGGDFNLSFARDPQTNLVYARDTNALFSFDPATSNWTQRSAEFAITSYKNAVIDPLRRRYYWYDVSSSLLHWYDISNSLATGLVDHSRSTSGCTFLSNDRAGWQYDPVLDRLVAWSNGDRVEVLDGLTGQCEARTFLGGPTAMENGTFGRFRYSPIDNLYVVCNAIDDNCYALRLTSNGLLFTNGFEN